MFARIINETTIEKAPCVFRIGSTTFAMPNAEQYAAGGYYEVVEVAKPSAMKWYNLVANYELIDAEDSSYTIKKTDEEGNTTEDVFPVEMKKIQQVWSYEKVKRPDYSELIVGYIRERYSINDELAIQRQLDNSPEKKQEFNEYNSFCDNCKLKAKADIAEWEEA